mmetsp:Transcript_14395/g.36417  ORF Transcript_14395/g.36417 Transcript_14395/m.36417 type:complete len:86 (+) Transcript_14395:814-1071(+)
MSWNISGSASTSDGSASDEGAPLSWPRTITSITNITITAQRETHFLLLLLIVMLTWHQLYWYYQPTGVLNHAAVYDASGSKSGQP